VTYAQIVDDTIQSVGRLPNSARRLDDGAWVMGLADASVELQQATGWFEVVDVPRPDDTATTTHDHSIELLDGTPTVVWTERDKTPDELANEQEQDNRTAIEANLADDLIAIQAIIDSTNADINSNPAARIKTMARMLRRLGRFAVNDLSGTD